MNRPSQRVLSSIALVVMTALIAVGIIVHVYALILIAGIVGAVPAFRRGLPGRSTAASESGDPRFPITGGSDRRPEQQRSRPDTAQLAEKLKAWRER